MGWSGGDGLGIVVGGRQRDDGIWGVDGVFLLVGGVEMGSEGGFKPLEGDVHDVGTGVD